MAEPTPLELRALAGWIGWGLNTGSLILVDSEGPVIVELTDSAALKLREQLAEDGYEHLLANPSTAAPVGSTPHPAPEGER